MLGFLQPSRALSPNEDDYDDLIAFLVNGQVKNRDISEWAKRMLKGFPGSVNRLVETLSTLDPRASWEIRNLLIDIGEGGVSAAIDQLEDTDTSKSLMILYILGQTGDARAKEPVRNLLLSSYPRVRSSAALASGGLGDTLAIDPLVTLCSDTWRMVRKSAVIALGRIGVADTPVLDSLARSLNDTWYFVRFTAVESLLLLDSNIVSPYLVRLLDSQDTFLVRNVLKYFSSVDGRIGALGLRLKPWFDKTRDPVVADYIFSYFQNIGDPDTELMKVSFQGRFGRVPDALVRRKPL